ncbi:group II intron reverse transcriptase/maturase [Desulforhopalus sp. IMCC35007]|uniref:group II intron reverse transcriptase/maturase n=1 Tax=Desulforhopalus sp. IMCC35007 TaxID=2569543 RepID=UPI0010AE0C9A|nr:group II intron reverse transcriptase/maturase [Desulforhopalus sp. IMCC35007]TKB11152.1 group II intron reverse transcriptase/maturase [Desulforhopalus sp. IMCC35007]
MKNEGKVLVSYRAVSTPSGGAASVRVVGKLPSQPISLERILATDNISLAWKKVKSNKGASGIDGVTIDEFPYQFRECWAEIRTAILEGVYTPKPVKRVEIEKPDGGIRPLGIPSVLDRVIQQAITQVIEPHFDYYFSESSFGFRPGRSAHGAIRRVKSFISEGRKIAVDADLSKFFDRVAHDVLMARVSHRISDKRVLKLIGKYLRAGVVINNRLQGTSLGVPQGGPLSPLLANIMLDDLDKELEKRGHRFCRYADDFIILVRSPRAGKRVMRSIRNFLGSRLKLLVNEQKSKVVPVERCTFLGFTFKRGKIRWTDKAFQKFKRRIRELTGRSWRVSMDYRMMKLRQYIRGWINYFGIAEYYRPVPGIDEWIRRRVRMCYWKQWRYARTKVRNLLKLGTNKRHAILSALSRKSYWHMSRTLATQSGMTNLWLADQGLVSIKKLWSVIHYPATAR